MKTYRALAYKELLASKITSVLILIAVILSTMMTTAIGQSLGILSAMRDQQAIALNGNRYATFVQMDQAQVDKIRADPRISYAGVSVSVGTVELNRILTLGLNEYWGDSLSAYPSLSQVEEGRLPERPMEIALPEDVLQMLGFSGDVDFSCRLQSFAPWSSDERFFLYRPVHLDGNSAQQLFGIFCRCGAGNCGQRNRRGPSSPRLPLL